MCSTGWACTRRPSATTTVSEGEAAAPGRAARARLPASHAHPALPPALPTTVDFGVATLQQHMKSFAFPWLLSNVLDSRTGEVRRECGCSRVLWAAGLPARQPPVAERAADAASASACPPSAGQPLGGAKRSMILEWGGVKVGLMGLVEREVRAAAAASGLCCRQNVAPGSPGRALTLPRVTLPMPAAPTLKAVAADHPECGGERHQLCRLRARGAPPGGRAGGAGAVHCRS